VGSGKKARGGLSLDRKKFSQEPEVLSQSLRYSNLLISMPLTYSESRICPGPGMG